MKRLLGSLLAGLSATLLMEHVSDFLYQRQSPASREREEQLRREMPTTTLVRKFAGCAGRQLDDTTAERIGMVTHYAFGASGGPAVAALIRAGVPPLGAGLTVGLGMFVAADEAFNTIAELTPPPSAFPAVTHARALVNHLAYGAAIGLLLDAGTTD